MKDGISCEHAGCLNHITHPCEECGRIGGIKMTPIEEVIKLLKQIQKLEECNLEFMSMDDVEEYVNFAWIRNFIKQNEVK